MKRILTFIFSAFIIVGAVMGLSACNKSHTHSTNNWDVVVDATCTEQGYRTGKCKDCGKTFTEYLDIIPHSFGEEIITKVATCKEEGTREKRCSVCDYAVTTIIPKAEHTPIVTKPEVLPKCDVDGSTAEYRCSKCNDLITESVVVPMTGHTYGDWNETDAPTCHKEGRREQTCSTCGHVNVEQVRQLEHIWESWQPDTEHPGYHTHKCSLCNDVQSFSCVYTDPKTEPETCTVNGKVYRTCTQCNYEFVERVIPMKNHNWVYVPIVVEDEEEDHVHKHYEMCTNCNEEHEPENCDSYMVRQEGKVEATCTTPEYVIDKCSKCKCEHEIITNPANGHTWVYTNLVKPSSFASLNCRHEKKCSVCNEITEERCPFEQHYYQETCESDAYYEYVCPLCKDNGGRSRITVSGTKLQHNFGPWEFDETSTDNNYEEAYHKRTCLRENCGEVEREKCEFDEISKLPTCTAPGEVTRACKYCHEAFSSEGAIATGHNWSTWKVYEQDNTKHYHVCENPNCEEIEIFSHEFSTLTVGATCEADAYDKKTCDKCAVEVIETKEGTAQGHNWKVSKITEEEHIAECSVCQEQAHGKHDWTESNICAICKHDGLTYKIAGQHATVVKSPNIINAKTKNIIINPHHKKLLENGEYDVSEYQVTEVAESAFYNNDNILSVTLSNTLVKLNKYAFNECSNLRVVEFAGENPVFETIGESAFYNCISLTKFHAPSSLKTISKYAFYNCDSLSDIVIPETVENIEPRAFFGTEFTNDNSHWSGDVLYIGKHLIKARNVLQDDGTYSNTTLQVEDGTITIAANAFSECLMLEKIILPNSLKHVDSDAFLNCENLHQVEFNGSVGEWLSITFVNDYSSPLCYGNAGLHVISIGSENGVVDLTDPDYVNHAITQIPAGTFRGLTDLKEIIIPSTITYIGAEAFEDCINLTKVTFSEVCNVAYCGPDVIKGCTAYYNNPDNWDNDVLYLGDCIIITAKTTITGVYNTKEGATVIIDGAFKNCENLEGIVISSTMQYVGIKVFEGCKSMSTITFTDPNYVWLCTNDYLLGFSRPQSKNNLNWGILQNYQFGWRRLYKTA